MGKQETVNQDKIQSNSQLPSQPTKKIIKKAFFKPLAKAKKGQEDDLKDWKPVKISQNIDQQKKKLSNEKLDLAQSFLHNLPKAKQEQKKEAKLSFDELSLPKFLKPLKKMEITEEQRKWDIQDQSFIKKEFEQQQAKPIEHELVEEQQEDGTTVDKVKWLNDPQIKQIDITKVIDKDWKQSTKKKDFQNGIWNNSLIKGKGQLSEFVRDAINRFDEEEEALNKRQQNKNKMRSRYGW